MQFTQEQIEKFIELGSKKELVTITGINNIGQKFTTKGILLAKRNEAGNVYYVGKSGLALYMGQDSPKGYELFCSFDAEYDPFDFKLYIENIKDSTGNVVFMNEDFAEIEKHAQAEAANNKHSDVCLSDKAKSYLNLIAKPVVIQSLTSIANANVVVKGIQRYEHTESISFTDGYVYHSIPVHACLISLDNQAKAKLYCQTYDEQENECIEPANE